MDVHVRLPTKDYDVSLAHASAARMDLADWIRHAIKNANTLPALRP